MKEEPKRRIPIKIKFLLFVLALLLIQCTISSIQALRYDYDGYNCVGMSRDCEYFFESLGIHVWQAGGYRYDAHGLAEAGHEWIILDFGFVAIPYESTCLLPFLDPAWRGFKNIEISPGYVDNGHYIDQPSWSEWI